MDGPGYRDTDGPDDHTGNKPAYRGRLAPVVGHGRQVLKAALADDAVGRPLRTGNAGGTGSADRSLVLVACSGGPDSLALAAVTAFFARRGDIAAGAVVVDHGLQQDSASVAARTASVLTGLGLNPVEVVAVEVDNDGSGPEGAARQARYRALDEAAERHGASTVLLGHTLDDQAEGVLLGLARGSGTRSLAGIPVRRGRCLRPFLTLRRADTEAICAAEGLQPWHDPTNSDPAYLRSRVRTEVLPYLEEKLGPGIAESLHRSSEILSEDADFLEAEAARVYGELAAVEPPAGTVAAVEPPAGGSSATVEPDCVKLPEHELRRLPPAVQHRVLALAAVALGAEQPSRERIMAAARLLQRHGSAGPVQLAGKVEVRRQVFERDVPSGKRGYGSLVFTAKR